MAAGGRYIIKVQGTLDDTKIREQLKAKSLYTVPFTLLHI